MPIGTLNSNNGLSKRMDQTLGTDPLNPIMQNLSVHNLKITGTVSGLNTTTGGVVNSVENFTGSLGGAISGTQDETVITDGAVDTAQLADSAVTMDKLSDDVRAILDKVDAMNTDNGNTNVSLNLGDNSVTTAKLANNSVTTAKLVDDSVTLNKMADGSVSTAQVVDASITSAKLADKSVTNAKLADGSVTLNKLSNDLKASLSQSATEAATNVVSTTPANIPKGSITSDKLAPGVLTTTSLNVLDVVPVFENQFNTALPEYKLYEAIELTSAPSNLNYTTVGNSVENVLDIGITPLKLGNALTEVTVKSLQWKDIENSTDAGYISQSVSDLGVINGNQQTVKTYDLQTMSGEFALFPAVYIEGKIPTATVLLAGDHKYVPTTKELYKYAGIPGTTTVAWEKVTPSLWTVLAFSTVANNAAARPAGFTIYRLFKSGAGGLLEVRFTNEKKIDGTTLVAGDIVPLLFGSQYLIKITLSGTAAGTELDNDTKGDLVELSPAGSYVKWRSSLTTTTVTLKKSDGLAKVSSIPNSIYFVDTNTGGRGTLYYVSSSSEGVAVTSGNYLVNNAMVTPNSIGRLAVIPATTDTQNRYYDEVNKKLVTSDANGVLDPVTNGGYGINGKAYNYESGVQQTVFAYKGYHRDSGDSYIINFLDNEGTYELIGKTEAKYVAYGVSEVTKKIYKLAGDGTTAIAAETNVGTYYFKDGKLIITATVSGETRYKPATAGAYYFSATTKLFDVDDVANVSPIKDTIRNVDASGTMTPYPQGYYNDVVGGKTIEISNNISADGVVTGESIRKLLSKALIINEYVSSYTSGNKNNTVALGWYVSKKGLYRVKTTDGKLVKDTTLSNIYVNLTDLVYDKGVRVNHQNGTILALESLGVRVYFSRVDGFRPAFNASSTNGN